MDLRIIKTKQNIKEAFFDLCKIKSIDKITIKELSSKAQINKATFYLHYNDIYDLADQIMNEIVEKRIYELDEYVKYFFTDQILFLNRFIDSFNKDRKTMAMLIKNNNYGYRTFKKTNQLIKEKIYNVSNYYKTLESEIALDIIFNSLFSLIPIYMDNNRNEAIKVMASFIENAIKKIK
ncbi:MAG: hypothetical protein SO253_00450 [Bacilli bacterium]|nr:hypothetical protein [Bacilli bacterium]